MQRAGLAERLPDGGERAGSRRRGERGGRLLRRFGAFVVLTGLIAGVGVFVFVISTTSAIRPPAPPDPLPAPDVSLTLLTEGFDFAVKMARLPDGRVLVTEKNTGRVRLVSSTFELRGEPVIDIAVNHLRERGLLGIAAHPNFDENRYVYIYYVASDSGSDADEEDSVSEIRVTRFVLGSEGLAENPQTLITLPARPGPYHNGGCILFGPDGKLYVSLGELNRNANVISQIKGSPRGKILRYNDDGTVPEDNPLGPENPAYVYGIRNSFGFSFDLDGTGLFVSDNGPSGLDRISWAMPGDNLGWPLVWGVVDRWWERLATAFLGEPFREAFWDSGEPPAVAPTAVGVIPNDLYGPGMTGRILMSDYVGRGVHQFSVDAVEMSFPSGHGTFVEGVSTVVDLQFDARGYLYILTTRALYRVDPGPAGEIP